MLVSQATADLIQEQGSVIDPECSALSDEGQTSQAASELEDTRPGSSLSDHAKSLGDLQGEAASSDLGKEVKRLQREKKKETERANQYQVKLEALQSQVTLQTKQLTMAFEKQSQHISGLLVELQQKESALRSQGEELQCYKQELDALKTEKEGEEKKRREEMTVSEVGGGEQKEKAQDERSVEMLELQAVSILTTNSLADANCDAQRDARQRKMTSDAETPTPVNDTSHKDALHSGSQATNQSNLDSAGVVGETECRQDGGTADVVTELLALRQENQLLKQRIEDLVVSDTPALHSDSENQEDAVKQDQNTGNAALSCLAEQRSLSVSNDISTDARQSQLQDVKRDENEQDLEREDGRTTRAEEERSELRINHLQQQVEELLKRIQALSAETQQQAEELVMWRLASKPAPTFDQFPPDTDSQSETQDQISSVRQSQTNQQQSEEKTQRQPVTLTVQTQVQVPYLGVQESPGNVTVIREDEVVLSCASNKLQGRMLFSRLQHGNLPELKSFHPSKKTTELQEYNRDTAKTDKESEKENQEINLLHQLNTCQTQHKEKRDTEVIQLSSEKTGQPQTTKDSPKVSGPKQNKSTECFTVNHEAKQEASRATNKIKTTSDSSDRYVGTEMKSVSSQTEESLYPRSAPAVSELHCAYTQTEEEEEEEEELVESPPVSPVPLSQGAELGEKVLFSGSFPIPADPARLAERIRRNRTQLSAAFDDTEYEPYGLPEVVMKGFADIPSGPSCPYIVRRGLLGTTAVPVPQKDETQEEEMD